MKKISLMFAAFAAALGFTACNETWDDNPVLNFHEGNQELNFLNQPEMQNMTVDITEENANEAFLMTCSQPKEYGYAASVAYTVEISVYEDFTAPEGVSTPGSVLLSTSYYDCSAITPTRREVAEALCKMLDIKEAAQIPTKYTPVYARLHAAVVNENGKPVTQTVMEGENAVTLCTDFTSNTVVLCKAVSCGYLAIIVPDLPTGIYIRGSFNGWLNDALNDEKPDAIAQLPKYEFVTTTESNVYELPFIEIPDGSQFKFADKGWGAPNLGPSGPIEYGVKTELAFNVQENITLSGAFKGSITLMGSNQTWSVIFYPLESDTPGQPSGIYLRGDMNGWGAESAYEFQTTDVKGVWECPNVTINPDQAFKVADANWGDINFGGTADKDVVSFNSNFSLDLGGENMKVADPFTGNVILRRKGNKYTLTLQTI